MLCATIYPQNGITQKSTTHASSVVRFPIIQHWFRVNGCYVMFSRDAFLTLIASYKNYFIDMKMCTSIRVHYSNFFKYVNFEAIKSSSIMKKFLGNLLNVDCPSVENGQISWKPKTDAHRCTRTTHTFVEHSRWFFLYLHRRSNAWICTGKRGRRWCEGPLRERLRKHWKLMHVDVYSGVDYNNDDDEMKIKLDAADNNVKVNGWQCEGGKNASDGNNGGDDDNNASESWQRGRRKRRASSQARLDYLRERNNIH